MQNQYTKRPPLQETAVVLLPQFASLAARLAWYAV